jgi:hypothetical protein
MAEIKIRMPGAVPSVDEYSVTTAGNKVSQDPSLTHSQDAALFNVQEPSQQGRYRAWLSSLRPHTTLLQKVTQAHPLHLLNSLDPL